MTKPSHLRSPRAMNPALPRYDSLVHMLLAAVGAHPNVTAVIYADRQISYAEFGRATAGLARELAKQGLGRGKRAILMMPNSIEMDVALMAVMATGAQVAPVNPFLTIGELRKALAYLICKAELERDIFSLNPPKLTQLLPERSQKAPSAGRGTSFQETYAEDFPCLLRMDGSAKR